MSPSQEVEIDLSSFCDSSNNVPMFCHSLAIGMSILNDLASSCAFCSSLVAVVTGLTPCGGSLG